MFDDLRRKGNQPMTTITAATLAPGHIALQEYPCPQVGPTDILLEILCTGICGSDKHMYLGHADLEFPVVPGHELIGKVVAMGDRFGEASNVVGGPLSLGDRVAVTPSTQGCGRCWFCQHVPHKPALCPNRMVYGFTSAQRCPHLYGGFARCMFVGPRSNVFRISDQLPTRRAVLAEPTAVATRAVERALGGGIPHIGEGIGIGKRVAVLGAGPIGLLVLAALRHMGAGTLIASDESDKRLRLARQMGADLTLDVKQTGARQRLDAIKDITDGVGPDVVVEAAGVPAAFAEGLAMVRRGGCLVEVGHYFENGSIPLSPHVICHKEVDVLGVWAYPPMQFETALSMLQRCAAPLEELLSATVSLEQLEQGLEMTGSNEVVKVVVEPGINR